MDIVESDACQSLEQAVVQELVAGGTPTRPLRDLVQRCGPAAFRDIAIRLYARLAPQEQQRLSVAIGLSGGSRTLAA
jgi:hypothetical protein